MLGGLNREVVSIQKFIIVAFRTVKSGLIIEVVSIESWSLYSGSFFMNVWDLEKWSFYRGGLNRELVLTGVSTSLLFSGEEGHKEDIYVYMYKCITLL